MRAFALQDRPEWVPSLLAHLEGEGLSQVLAASKALRGGPDAEVDDQQAQLVCWLQLLLIEALMTDAVGQDAALTAEVGYGSSAARRARHGLLLPEALRNAG
jgi:hypothetical protein